MDAVLMLSARMLLRTAIGTSLLLCLVAGQAHGHAFPQSQSPPAGASLATAPEEIVIGFDCPIAETFARLDVFDAAGANHAIGAPRVDSDLRTISVRVAPLAPGDYSVSWSAVSDDGHRSEGSYVITVGGEQR